MPAVPDQVFISVPIQKSFEDSDGDLHVIGKATGPDLDLDDQIIDKDFARKALGDWFRDWGNVRQMHSTNLPPAGKAISLTETPDGFDVETKVVDANSKALVKAGVYQAYSIGISKPRIVGDRTAKAGRVVDGIVSELSLVDFPANPTCRLTLAKRAETGEIEDQAPEFTETAMAKMLEATVQKSVDESEGKCGLCGGDGKIRGGHVKCPDCGGSGKLSDVSDEDKAAQRRRGELKVAEPDAAKRNFDPSVGGGVDRDKIPAEDFAGKDRSFPIVTPGDVSDAASSIGRAGSDNYSSDQLKANIIRIARRKGKAFVDELPEAWKKEAIAKEASPIIRQLHDAVCGAYPLEAVKAAHPEIAKNGLAAAFGPMTQQLVYRLLANETEEDGGDGHNAWSVQKLASAYAMLYEFLQTEGRFSVNGVDWHADPENVLRSARADLEKAVISQNPDLPVLTPTNMTPGKWKRPYIRAGHAVDYARPGQHPRIPPADHVPSASDFDRGLIVAGHESDSPQNTGGAIRPVVTHAAEPDLTKANRTFYTNDAKGKAQAVMQAMHDHIADVYPEICPMAPGTNEDYDHPGQLPKVNEVPNKAESVPAAVQPSVEPVPDLAAVGEPDLVKVVTASVQKAVDAVRAEMQAEIDTLRKQVKDLESSPDPNAPVTNVPGGQFRLTVAGEEPVDPAKLDKINRLRAWQESGDPSLRLAAEQMLAKLI